MLVVVIIVYLLQCLCTRWPISAKKKQRAIDNIIKERQEPYKEYWNKFIIEPVKYRFSKFYFIF